MDFILDFLFDFPKSMTDFQSFIYALGQFVFCLLCIFLIFSIIYFIFDLIEKTYYNSKELDSLHKEIKILKKKVGK